VALHPLAVFTGKASFVTSEHDAGTPVCIGPGDAEGRTLVLRVDGRTLTVELSTGALLLGSQRPVYRSRYFDLA
jgi:hypothetical protein